MLLFISTAPILKTQEECGKDANWTQEGRRSDAVQTQSRRKADAERRRTDASQKRPEAWTQEGRMRDADGSISYSPAHMIFIVFGSFVA